MSLTPEIIRKLKKLSPQDRERALIEIETELENRAPGVLKPKAGKPSSLAGTEHTLPKIT
jgi:mRNA-degrading endonuclease RelE of RelBE toxin-antitoxin system